MAKEKTTKAKLSKSQRSRIRKLKQERKQLSERLMELKERLKALEAKKVELQRDLQNAREHGDSFENQDVENINNELRNVELNIAKLQEEISNLETEIASKEELIAAIERGEVIEEPKLNLDVVMQSHLKDFLVRELLDREFEVNYLSEEVEKLYGISKVKLRFVGSDEHVNFEDDVKSVSVTSPIGEMLMEYLQEKLKADFSKRLKAILEEELGDALPKRRTKRALPKSFSNLIEKLVDSTLLSLDKSPNDFLDTLKKSIDKVDLKNYIDFDEVKLKVIIRDAIREAFLRALEELKVDKAEFQLHLPELRAVRVKLKAKR